MDANSDDIDVKRFEDYFQLIIKFILNDDKYRSKLLNLTNEKNSISYECAFPIRDQFECFEYIGSGSYAQVYRQKFSSNNNNNGEISNDFKANIETDSAGNSCMNSTYNSNDNNGGNDKIIKFIEVFSDCIIKNLHGIHISSSITNYKDVYNEFRISINLSYLNYGIRLNHNNYGYLCPLFPIVYDCFLIKHSKIPEYFQKLSSKSNQNNNDNDNKSKCIFKFDYRKLIDSNNNVNDESNDSDDENNDQFLLIKNQIRPEVAAIKMEDCGQSLYDQLATYNPVEILSITKQLLLGFIVAEKIYEFEHRDLHLGNILIKNTANSRLTYVYDNEFIHLSSYNLMVKVIDTTFSRLKIKNRIHFRNLSHLFDQNDLEQQQRKCETYPNHNHLLHQNDTYKAMAVEINNDWQGFYPRTNIYWLIYILRKFLNVMRKKLNEKTSTTTKQNNGNHSSSRFRFMNYYHQQTRSIIKYYIHSLFKSKSLKYFYHNVFIRKNLNHLVPLRRFKHQINNNSINDNNQSINAMRSMIEIQQNQSSPSSSSSSNNCDN